MRIGQLGGEFALIDRIAGRVSAAPSATVALGIGDDAALLPAASNDQYTVVTTDLLIEEIHFRRAWADPYSLGAKAIAVNLSDIAAMGGTPTATFLALALPPDADVAFVDELYRGIGDTCLRFGATVAGGDTNVSPGPLVVSVTQMGLVSAASVWRRSGARIGDRVIVTGALGAAAAGLVLLESEGRTRAEADCPEAVRAQLTPTPRLREAYAAAASGGVTAAMDLSDGLIADLNKLCRASGVGASVDLPLVPTAKAAYTVATYLDKGAETLEKWVLRGGEDYELLLTASPADAARLCATITGATGTPATIIGEIVSGEGVELSGDGNQPVMSLSGWDHFVHN